MKKLLLIICFSTIGFIVKSQTPIAHYTLNGNANDVSGNNLNGTITGTVTPAADRYGNPNSAESFDGSSRIDVADNPLLRSPNITISAWLFSPISVSGTQTIAAKNLCSGVIESYGIFHHNGQIVASWSDGSPSEIITAPGLSAGIWHMVTFIFDDENNMASLYVDGVLANSQSSNISLLYDNSSFSVGSEFENCNHDFYLSETVDDVKIYGTALNATQIKAEYAYGNQYHLPGSGNALEFDGTSNTLWGAKGILNINSFGFNHDFTIECWAKINPIQNDIIGIRNIIILQEANQATPYAIAYENQTSSNAGKIFAYRYDLGNGAVGIHSTAIVGDNKWHHILFKRDGGASGVLRLYVDGILQASSSDNLSSYPTGFNQLFIGGENNGDPDYAQQLTGKVDEVRIWTRGLNEIEIRDRMCRKITSSDPLYGDLGAYYNFDELNGGVTFDGSINVKNGGQASMNSLSRTISGAAIGNQSTNSYVATGLPTANLSYNSQDNLAVELTAGTYTGEAGTHVYVVNEKPSSETGINGVGTNDRYFGVFNANITSPSYTATYNYDGNSFVTIPIENTIALYKRFDNSEASWSEIISATRNTTANTLTTTGQNTEYMLGIAAAPLPLTLLSFSGKNTVAGNELTWKTTNETNFSHFEIQRSSPLTPEGGISIGKFEKIGQVKAFSSENYEYRDSTPPSGEGGHFYRLKLIDLDGKYSYSKIIRIENETQFSFKIYPNPVIDNLNIIANLKESGNYQIQVLNEIGQVKINQNTYLKAGNNSISIPVHSLQKGLYFVVIQGDKSLIKVLKFVK